MSPGVHAGPVRLADAPAPVHEVDVLVVGLGCAGASAALEAARAGASVLALDRAGGPGGSSALSGGEIYLGGGTALQRACGFDDDPDQMYAYLHAALGPHPDEEKLRLYCDGSVEHFEWLRALGVEFEESLYDGVSWLPPTRDGLMWLGENAWPFTTLARPAPRGHRPATDGFGGWLLMDRLMAAVADAGVEVRADTRAVALLTDDDGRVAGVLSRRFGQPVAHLARGGVVLATGGFVDDDALLADHVPALVGQGKVSDGLDDGSGLRLGQSVGAAVRRLGSAQVALSVVPALACRGILVDGLGRRFVNEDVYPGRLGQAAVHQPGPFFTIVDEKGWEDVPERERWGVRPAATGETLAELEAELGMPPRSVEETVARYNRDAVDGEDLLFHKDPRWLRPLEPPYAAVAASDGFDPDGTGRRAGTGVSGFTLGGLRTSVDGEVLDLAGAPIPGLLAAGRVAAGIHGDGYVSGTSLGDGTFFGRRAGRAAAAAAGRGPVPPAGTRPAREPHPDARWTT